MNLAINFLVGLSLSSALLSGLLFVFSNFAIKALSRLPAESGVAAMQAINSQILNSGFLGIFTGTATGSIAALVVAIQHWHHPASVWVAAGTAILLIGLYLITAAINVPLNKQLDTIDPTTANTAAAWKDYVTRWQPWNHFRTAASFLAAICFAIGALKIAGA